MIQGAVPGGKVQITGNFTRDYAQELAAQLQSGRDDHLRFCWCDGLIPERYDRHGQEYHISGMAWIGQHKQSSQERWHFTLIARHVRERNEIDWQELLPGEG